MPKELTAPKKCFNRKSDGHSYYFQNGILVGCPTFVGGVPDFMNGTAVDDFEERLSNKEIRAIKKQLNKILSHEK